MPRKTPIPDREMPHTSAPVPEEALNHPHVPISGGGSPRGLVGPFSEAAPLIDANENNAAKAAPTFSEPDFGAANADEPSEELNKETTLSLTQRTLEDAVS